MCILCLLVILFLQHNAYLYLLHRYCAYSFHASKINILIDNKSLLHTLKIIQSYYSVGITIHACSLLKSVR